MTAALAMQTSLLLSAEPNPRVPTLRWLTRDTIDGRNARSFVLSYPKPEYRPAVRGANVVRDKNQPIVVNNGEIWQTGVRIGRYDTTGFTIAGFPVTQVNIYYVDTVHCATVTHGTKPADSVASVFTARDKRNREVKRDQSASLLLTVLRYLVGEGYL